MKWSNFNITKAHLEDLRVQRDSDLGKIIPFVNQIACTFSRDSVAIGILDFNDLLQSGYVGLVTAWNKVDWELINKAENSQGKLWSFLKKSIKRSIRRDIDRYSSFVSRPINLQEELRTQWDPNGVDKVLVTVFPRFFDNQGFLGNVHDNTPWISIQLELLIDDALAKHVKNVDHRNMLLKFYGIGFEKTSMKKLAKEYGISDASVAKIVQRTRDKLNNEEFKKIIENFIKNES